MNRRELLVETILMIREKTGSRCLRNLLLRTVSKVAERQENKAVARQFKGLEQSPLLGTHC